jgi:hypothetical protein
MKIMISIIFSLDGDYHFIIFLWRKEKKVIKKAELYAQTKVKTKPHKFLFERMISQNIRK